MRAIEKRNLEILFMRERGIPYGEIAPSFDISRDRVHQVIQELDLERKAQTTSRKDTPRYKVVEQY
jgi:hypothetical protein